MLEYSLDPLLFNVFALSTLLLSVKALFLGAATAAMRGKVRQFVNQEDAQWLGGAQAPADGEDVARVGRAHRNDLENLVLFALVGSVFLAIGGNSYAGIAYCIIFVVARLVHTLAYLGKRPALRRNMYTLGFLIILAMAVHAAVIIADVV